MADLNDLESAGVASKKAAVDVQEDAYNALKNAFEAEHKPALEAAVADCQAGIARRQKEVDDALAALNVAKAEYQAELKAFLVASNVIVTPGDVITFLKDVLGSRLEVSK